MNRYTLPTSITVNDEPFEIRDKGDFRMVLSCFNIISNVEYSMQDRILACLRVFYEDFDDFDTLMSCKCLNELTEKMMWFLNCGQEDLDTSKQSPKLVDWDKDANLICSAINNVAGKEIRAESYLHWWTFIGYYMAIGECALSQIVAIRYKLFKGEKLEKHEKKFMNENPQFFKHDYRTAEQKADEEYIKSLWEGGNK